MASRWTKEEDSLLATIYQSSLKRDITSKIRKPWEAIYRRAYKLGLKRDQNLIEQDKLIRGARKDQWTSEEDNLLKQVYPNSTKKEILKKIDRSWKAIYQQAESLKLKRNKDIVKEEQIDAGRQAPPYIPSWSEHEDTLLRELYYSTPKYDILKKINRSWWSIRRRAVLLGIKRSKEVIENDNTIGNKTSMKKRRFHDNHQ